MTVADVDASALPRRCDAALVAYFDRQHAGWPDGTPRGLLDAVRRFVLAGGKRLRPMFCYWGWRGAGGPDEPGIVAAAAALELFHAFALIHDDIMDGSERRRGRPSMHRHFAEAYAARARRGDAARYGQSAALLSGDLCAAWADQMFRESGLPPDRLRHGYRVFAAMRTEAIAGQYLDLVSGVGDGTVAGALTLVRLKAARYTVTRPLQVGAALAGAGPELMDALMEFGDPLGDAFQMRDDMLGVFGDPALTGKPVLDDLRDGKPTVMMVLAREMADRPQAVRLKELVGDRGLDEAGADEVRAVITATGARQRIEEMIAARVAFAVDALATAPIDEAARSPLLTLAGWVTDRNL